MKQVVPTPILEGGDEPHITRDMTKLPEGKHYANALQ